MTDKIQHKIQNEVIINYLSVRNMKANDDKILLRMNNLIDELKNAITPRYTYEIFDIKKYDSEIAVSNTSLVLTGKNIAKFLEKSERIVLMAITMGLLTDRFILRNQKRSLTDGILADSIASAYIEKSCDVLQAEIAEQFSINSRYSCGYGDLPIEIQPEILNILNTEKTIGLCCNEKNIMLPRKSVTAIMGILS